MNSQAAELLYSARAGGQRPVLMDLDLSRPEALELQLQVLDRFVADGDAPGGWKVSFTSGGSRDRMGPGYRPFGYVLRSHIFPSGRMVTLPAGYSFSLEPELCLVLAAPLPGPVDRCAARAALAGVAPAFEINQSRVPAAATEAVRLADGTGNWGIVAGPPNAAAARRDRLAATAVHIFRDEREVGRSPEDMEMDDPIASLATLAGMLAAHGRSLHAGDHVITGSFTRVAVTGPSRWRAVFDDVGEVAVELVL